MIFRRHGRLALLGFGVVCLAMACGAAPHKELSRDELQTNCDGGVARDCGTLGFQLAFRSGTHDYEQARVALQRACDGGDLYFCPYLAALYENGLGVQQDFAQALSIYRSGCNVGNPLACVHVGLMYEHGRGVQKDVWQARSLYLTACGTKPGNPATGWGCAKLARLIKTASPTKAHVLSKRSCDLENAEGCQQLASDLLTSGSVSDQAEAMKLLDHMCKKGMTEACDQKSGKRPYNWSDQDEVLPNATDSK